MGVLRRFLPMALILGLFLSVVISPRVEQDANATADPLTPEERAFVAAHGPIRYAPDPMFPPFEFLDSSGVARGITPDLLTIMGKKLGVEFRTAAYPTWSDVLEAVKQGKVDLLGTLTRTPEREGFLLFSKPYLSVPYVLFVRQDVDTPKTIDDMVSRRLGVVKNYGINTWLSVSHPNIIPIAMEDTATGLTMVATGQLDALLEALPVGAQIVRDKSLTNLRIVPRHIYTLPQYFGVRKKAPLLLSIVQKGLDSLTEAERSEVFVRWTGQDFTRPPPVISPLLRDALLILVAAAVLSGVWIVTLRRSVRRATQSLQESEERYRSLFDKASDGIFIMSYDGKLMEVNESFARMHGYSKGELLQMNISDLDTTKNDHLFTKRMHQLLAGEILSFEVEHNHKDGHVFPLEVSANLISIGVKTCIQSFHRNITERKRAEEESRRTNELFRSAFEEAPGGMCLVSPEGRFLRVNNAFCLMIERPESELLAMSFMDVTHPEDRSASREWVGKILAGEEVPKTLEKRYIRKSGHVLWGIVASFLLRSDNGAPLFFITHIQDITERKRAEEALRESETRYHSIFDYGADGIVIIDPDTAAPIEFNQQACTQLGYSREEFGRLKISDVDLLEGPEEAKARIQKVINTGYDEFETLQLTKDGKQRDVHVKAQYISIGGKSVYHCIWRDITDHKRAEAEKEKLQAQLQQAMKMEAIGRLAGGVAHDFNNLLTVITGYSELLLLKIGKESPMHGEVEEIKRAGERAAALTQQLLAFSRKQIIEPKILDLNVLTADVGKMLIRLIGENIDLKIGHGKNLGLVKVDPGQFDQVLINLVVNARDAMPEGGTLLIETANVELDEEYCAQHPYEIRPGRFVRLAVSDTGHGMTKETSRSIFEPFFTTKEKGKGTGLGLSMVYGAVKQAGGSIEAYSEVGIGTTFKIYLPRVDGDAVKPVETDRPTILAGGTETVLVVEDEEIVLNLSVQILERLGYKVMPARNGADAIVLAQQYGDLIDLLLTDMVMPGMNGSELATQLVLNHPEMKVLFTSGYTEDVISHHGVLAEGVSFIGKPYTPLALARKVREVLDKA